MSTSNNKISLDIRSETNNVSGSQVNNGTERETYQTHKTYQRDEVKGPSGHIIREITTDTDTRSGKHVITEKVYNVGGLRQ